MQFKIHSGNRIKALLFTIVILVFQFSTHSQFIISSGVEGGNYYKTGLFLEEILKELYPNKSFKNLASSGSIENVQSIDERFSDFAIAQRDVLLESIYNEENGLKNIELILPLFKENLLLYARKSHKIQPSFFEFAKSIKKIGVTSKTSSSFKVFEKICRLLSIPFDRISVEEGNYFELHQKLKDNEIDLIVSFSLPILEIENNVEIISTGFSKKETSLITRKITNVFQSKISSDKNLMTIGSWTFLVALDQSVLDINETSKELLTSNLITKIKHSKNPIASKINSSIQAFKKQGNHKFLYGFELSESLPRELNYGQSNLHYFLFLTLALILAIIIILSIRKKILTIDIQIIWIRYKHIIIGILSIFLLYFISVEAILASEKEFYSDLGIKSKVLNLTKKDLHFWIVITNLTGNNNNIFPSSYVGQIMLSFSSYIILLGTIIVAFWEYVTSNLNKKRIKGLMDYNFKDHIVIIGWKDNSHQFLEEIIDAGNNYKKEKRRIICIATDPEKLIKKNEKLKKLNSKRLVEFISGDAREESTFEKANLHLANTVVILSEGTSKQADEKTLLRALAISRFCRKMNLEGKKNKSSTDSLATLEKVMKYQDSIYIIAEINDEKFAIDLKNSDVNEIINASEYSKNILTQSILNHGVSKVMDEILTYNEFNEFYTMDLKKSNFKGLVGLNFDQLLFELRKKGILLIAIRIVYHDKNGTEIIDENRLKELLKGDGYNRQIMVNPTSEKDKERCVDDDDQLIVFCSNGKVLTKQF